MKRPFVVLLAVSLSFLSSVQCKAQQPPQPEVNVQAQVFELKLGDNIATTTATLDDQTLVIESHLNRTKMQVADLTSITYTRERIAGRYGRKIRFAYRPEGDRHDLGLTFAVNDADPGTEALLAELRRLRPDLAASEATELERTIRGPAVRAFAPYAVALLVVVALAFPFIPFFVHGFDFGHREVDVAELSDPDFESETRNLTVNGRPLTDKAMVHRYRFRYSEVSETVFPLVDETWQPGDPVSAFITVGGELDEAAVAEIHDRREFTGVLRNVWWEGLRRRDRAYFRNRGELLLGESIHLIHSGARPRIALYVGIPVLLLVAFFAYVVARALHMRATGQW